MTKTRKLGDAEVFPIGLGGMPMSIEGRPDRSRSIATVHAALDAGVTLVDTADAYHVGADEVGQSTLRRVEVRPQRRRADRLAAPLERADQIGRLFGVADCDRVGVAV